LDVRICESSDTEFEGLFLFETARSEKLGHIKGAVEQADARDVANYADKLVEMKIISEATKRNRN